LGHPERERVPSFLLSAFNCEIRSTRHREWEREMEWIFIFVFIAWYSKNAILMFLQCFGATAGFSFLLLLFRIFVSENSAWNCYFARSSSGVWRRLCSLLPRAKYAACKFLFLLLLLWFDTRWISKAVIVCRLYSCYLIFIYLFFVLN